MSERERSSRADAEVIGRRGGSSNLMEIPLQVFCGHQLSYLFLVLLFPVAVHTFPRRIIFSHDSRPLLESLWGVPSKLSDPDVVCVYGRRRGVIHG
jgi:hypothetical protein